MRYPKEAVVFRTKKSGWHPAGTIVELCDDGTIRSGGLTGPGLPRFRTAFGEDLNPSYEDGGWWSCGSDLKNLWPLTDTARRWIKGRT